MNSIKRKLNFKKSIHFNINVSTFIFMCKNGHFEMAKWIFQMKPNIDINIDDKKVFYYACRNGHLVVAQWLYQIMIIEKYRIVDGVHAACKNGYFKVAKWLFKKIKKIINKYQNTTIWINFNLATSNSFPIICKNGDLKIAKWLLQIKPNIDISSTNEEAFRGACEYGHLKVAQWLFQIKPDIDIFARNEEAFCNACKNEHLEIAEWFVTLKPDIYSIDVNLDTGLITPIIMKPLKIIATIEKSENDICSICFVETSTTEVETQCNHQFHKKCIAMWINTNKMSCPICRQSMENGFNIIL
jgi:hypothetical protein